MKSPIKARLGFFVLVIASCFPSLAEQTSASQGQYSAEDLVRIALRQNAELLAFRQQVVAGRGAVAQAQLRPNPTVTFSGLRQAGGTDNQAAIGGSVPLELFGRRASRVEVATAELTEVQYQLADRERLLAAEVRAKYGAALAMERNLQFTRSLLSTSEQSLRLTAARVERRASPALDESIVRIEVNRIDTLRTTYEEQLETLLLDLRNLTGMNPEQPLRLKDTFRTAPIALTREAALAAALSTRPDVLAARAAEASAAARLKQAQIAARADASAFVEYRRVDTGFDVNGITAAGGLRRVQGVFNYFSGGVSVTLPVRNKNQGAIQAAVAELEATRRHREFVEQVVSREIALAYVRYSRARQNVAVYERGVRAEARTNLATIEQAQQLGRLQLLHVVAEQRRFIELETGYTDVLNHYYQSLVELERAASVSLGGDGNGLERVATAGTN